MAVKMSMNAVVFAPWLSGPKAAQAVCIDDPCPPAANRKPRLRTIVPARNRVPIRPARVAPRSPPNREKPECPNAWRYFSRVWHSAILLWR